MKRLRVGYALLLLVSVTAVTASVVRMKHDTPPQTASYTPANDSYNSQDLLPSQGPPGIIQMPQTNQPEDTDTYLGGSLYARPDGEVFTAFPDDSAVPDPSTLYVDQSYYPVGSPGASGHQ